MSGVNGHRLDEATVQLVGQPYTLLRVSPNVLLVCNCDAKTYPVLVEGLSGVGKCPGCRKVYKIAAALVQFNKATSKYEFSVQLTAGIPVEDQQKPALLTPGVN